MGAVAFSEIVVIVALLGAQDRLSFSGPGVQLSPRAESWDACYRLSQIPALTASKLSRSMGRRTSEPRRRFRARRSRPALEATAAPAPPVAAQGVEDEPYDDSAERGHDQGAEEGCRSAHVHLVGREPTAGQAADDADRDVRQAAGRSATPDDRSGDPTARKPTTIQPTMSRCGTAELSSAWASGRR